MSTQASHSNKTKQLSSAVVIAMTASTSAYAVNFGKTSIQSTQYEPLSATIEVNGISSQDFDVSLANNAIYGQMGLTPNGNINAKFERTSADAGRVVLTSSQPIDEPFADIVLNIDNSDKKQFMPKTLLMPIGNTPPTTAQNNQPVNQNTQPAQQVVRSKPKPNLPAVTQNLADGMPNDNNQQATTNEFAKQTAKNQKSAVMASEEVAKETQKDFKLDKAKENNLKTVNNNFKAKNIVTTTQEPAIGKVASDRLLLKDLNAKAKKVKKSPTKASSKHEAKSAHANKRHSTYVVQHNDNLWTIALEIAKSNKLNVHTVMKQIHANNPNAFIGGKANRIITNSKLVLPGYKVVQSQKSLEKAIQARRSKVKATKKRSVRKVVAKHKSKSKAKKPTKVAKSTKKTTRRKATKNYNVKSPKKQSTPRVSLVAPNKSSKVNSKNSASSSKGSLVTKLKSTRQKTAQQASRVNTLNSKVSSYTQKLQMQNQKLAELEARLKKLKGQ